MSVGNGARCFMRNGKSGAGAAAEDLGGWPGPLTVLLIQAAHRANAEPVPATNR